MARGQSLQRQLWLEFIEQEDWEALWEGFPESARTQVTRQSARLMAQMLAERVGKGALEKEAGDEPSDE
jgi:hypothetical protein